MPSPQELIPVTCKSPESKAVAGVMSSVFVSVVPSSLVVIPSVHVHLYPVASIIGAAVYVEFTSLWQIIVGPLIVVALKIGLIVTSKVLVGPVPQPFEAATVTIPEVEFSPYVTLIELP